MKSLDIRVAFSAIDRLTRPVNAARQSAGGLTESLKKTQAAINDLDKQSKTFNRLRDSVQKTSRQIDEAGRSLDGLNKAQRNGTVLTDKQREHMAALAAKMERLNATRDAEMVKLRASAQALRGHGVSLTGSTATLQSAIRRTEQYNQTLERERRQLAAVTQARARYDRMQQTAQKRRNGGSVAVATAAAGMYAGTRMLTPQVQAEGSGAVIAAQSGENTADGGRYTRLIQDINSSGVSHNLEAVSEALSVVRSALGSLGDVGDSELSRITRKTLDMQKVFKTDLAEGIQTAAILMKNKLANSSDEAFDLMTAGMQKMSASMRGELPEILHEYSTHFRNMGFTGREAMSLLVDMSQQGKFALDKTGDAIKEFSIRGSDMSKKSIEAYKQIGLCADAMSSAIVRGGTPARAAMQKTASGLLAIRDPAERANAAISLFGTPIEDLSVDQIPAFLSALANTSDRLGDVQGKADKMGDTLRNTLQGDLDKLVGSLSGLRADVFNGITAGLRGLTQTATQWVNQLRGWVQANPELTRTLLIVGGSALALTAAIGATSLAAGLLLGPLAKLQLGFTLLTGGRGIGGAITMFQTLGGVAGGSMARAGGWSQIMKSLSGGFSRLPALLKPVRGMLFSVFTSPLSALTALGKGIGGLLLRLTGLPAIGGIITGAVSLLGGALSALLSPIGLIGAAFVGVGALIWRHWELIKAFFSGMFSGIMQQLSPFRDAFFTLTLVFGAIGDAVGRVWDGFMKLFTPVDSSRQALEKCTSAGETFGRVLGAALTVLLWPLQKLMEGIGWVLEKLDLIPSGLEAARIKAESLKKDPVMWEWDPQQKKMVQKGWNWSPKPDGSKDGNTKPPTVTPPPLLTGETGTQRRLQKIADNTTGLLDETKKRIGPGDIVFKNLPRALAVRGEWQESRFASPPMVKTGAKPSTLAMQPHADIAAITSRPVVVAASQPVFQAELPPVSPTNRAPSLPSAVGSLPPEIHIHLHGAERQDAREIGRIVSEKLNAELARLERMKRGSFRDAD